MITVKPSSWDHKGFSTLFHLVSKLKVQLAKHCTFCPADGSCGPSFRHDEGMAHRVTGSVGVWGVGGGGERVGL